MFFAKILNYDGAEIPVIRLIDTGTVDSDQDGNPRKVFIWSKDKKAGDHSRYYWDQIMSEAELNLDEESIVFTGTGQSGYEVWSRLVNMLSEKLHDNAKSIVNYPKFRVEKKLRH